MSFKKEISKSGSPYIIGTNEDQKNAFLPGFRYKLGSVEYTVRKIIDKDSSTQMRRLICSDGTIEDVTVETIIKDLKDEDSVILPINESIAKSEGFLKEEENGK